MKRIGLITLAMMLAVGSLGIAYAAWTDTITIDGAIETGTVDLVVDDYSGTWVYKLPDHGLANVHCWMSQKEQMAPADAIELVSYAEARAGDADEADVVVTFDNLFPCQWLTADVLLHYNGSIPARLWAEGIVDPNAPDALVDNLDVQFAAWKLPGFTGSAEDKANIHTWLEDPANLVDIGEQVHGCNYVLVAMSLHVPQMEEMMSLDGDFKARIVAVQWNKYDEWLATEMVPMTWD